MKGKPGHRRAVKSMLRYQRSWDELAQATFPRIPADFDVQVIYGAQDWGPAKLRDRTAELVPAIDDVTIVPDTGHFTFLENPRVALDALLPS